MYVNKCLERKRGRTPETPTRRGILVYLHLSRAVLPPSSLGVMLLRKALWGKSTGPFVYDQITALALRRGE